MKEGLRSFKTSESYARAKEIADEILSGAGGEKTSFLLPVLANSVDFFSVLPENALLVFDEGKTLWDKFNALYKEHEERFHRLSAGEARRFLFLWANTWKKAAFSLPFRPYGERRFRRLRVRLSFSSR